MIFILIAFEVVLIISTQFFKNYDIPFLHSCNATYVAKKTFNEKSGDFFYNFLSTHNNLKKFSKLFMTKKFKYKYKNSLEKRIRKGRIRNEINQKLKKKNSAYIVITEKLSKLDPEQKYFKYDKNILKEYENIKDIYKNKKLGRKFNQYDYWYSSKKKEAKNNYSRHVNFAITENKFNFKNVFSYFHILEIVHEKFKNNSFYINGLQSFINKYYDPVTQKRIKYYDKIKEQIEMRKKNGEGKSKQNDEKGTSLLNSSEKRKVEGNNLSLLDDLTNEKVKTVVSPQDDASLNEGIRNILSQNTSQKNEDEQSCKEIQAKKNTIKTKKEFFEMIKKNLSELQYSNEVNEDSSFTLFGSSTSCLLKKNGPIAYDIKNPFMKSKMSSKRRRFKERKLFDIINFKCKNRRERLMQTAVRKLAKRKLKNENYILDPMEPA
ncbi:hypothetical protein, conserved [Plasmodium gonderi]|uniref:Protein AMR3 n=1 Tax=Plasmodium gonderi TaxID=77519 RepID=A0A1Y1JL55_PLAGO|nr:hypothetical protein, conserved [Plasmodium gonderi]GAW83259.1 hypothetical protein, conserved [Plasmodium gonderi]